MTWKFNGKGSLSINHLSLDNEDMNSLRDIADTFAKKCCSENYCEHFQKFKAREEKKTLNCKQKNLERYNKLFSLQELGSTLSKAHDTSPGQDKIHYQFLKHLPCSSLSDLLDIFNEPLKIYLIHTIIIYHHDLHQQTRVIHTQSIFFFKTIRDKA